jgi:ADP-heptose:LPS heptosyltransferase
MDIIMDEKKYLHIIREEVKRDHINKILIIPRDRIGDCISETPLFKILRKRFPHATISALMTPYTKDIVTNNPHVDTVYIYHRIKRLKMGILLRYAPFFYLWHFHKLLKELDKESFDLIISLLRPIRELRYIFKHIRYRFLINRDTVAHFLSDHGVTKQTPYYERNLFLLRALGIDAKKSRGEIFWTREDMAFIDGLLTSFSLKATDLVIAFHPGCARSKKEKSLAEAKRAWPFKNYPETIKKLRKECNVKIILTGVQREETEVNNDIKSRVGEGVYVVSRTTINQFAYLLSKCKLMLSTDTGGLHIAAAVGTPIVALSGPTTAQQYSPFMPQGFLREVTANIACRPCNLDQSCSNNICMQKISVDDVLQAIMEQLKRHSENVVPQEN